MSKINVQDFYTYLQSQETAQRFLLHSYQHLNISNPKIKSYENCHTFLYYLKHGLHFYETGKKTTTMIQPILLFYGMAHLIKASLLIKRPDYPESTKLLAHGVSSRKRKKRNYTFMEDKVTIHNHGLYSYFSKHLYHINNPILDKYKMKDLLTLIPEMSTLFSFHHESDMSVIGDMHSQSLTFGNHLLDSYHLTSQAFIERIKPYLPSINHTNINQSNIQLTLEQPFSKSFGPFFFHITDETVYFPKTRELFLPISEVMVHYLLLYNLSMLSRYDAEWWGELLTTKPDIDFPFIKLFLHHTAWKIPVLLGQEMYYDYLLCTTN